MTTPTEKKIEALTASDILNKSEGELKQMKADYRAEVKSGMR